MTSARTSVDPRLIVLGGSIAISSSSMFVVLSGTGPVTASLFRCLFALPILLPLAWWHGRRNGLPILSRGRLVEVGAGALLGLDLVLWSQSILDLGAGIATVLVNIQVVVVPLLARFGGERISSRFVVVVPLLLIGVGLASGMDDPGPHTLRGALCGIAAGIAYGGYLALMRSGSASGDRFGGAAAATVGAGLVCVLSGLVFGGITVDLGWAAFGWLIVLALSGQVVGWVLITAGMRRLRASVGATLLLFQPVLSVGWGALVLGERPDLVQLGGCVLVLASMWLVTRERAVPSVVALSPENATTEREERVNDGYRSCPRSGVDRA